MRPLLHEAHDVLSDLQCFIGLVGDLQPNQQIGKAHEPQPNFARAFCPCLDGRQRVAVHINNVIEKAHGQGSGFRQSGIVDGCRPW